MPRRKKDPDMPKRPLSSYMFYSKERRPKVQQEQPTLAFGDYSKLIAAEWKKLTPEDKEPYLELSQKDKLRYDEALKVYKEKKKNEPQPYELGQMNKNFTTQDNINAHQQQMRQRAFQNQNYRMQYLQRQRLMQNAYGNFNPYMVPELSSGHIQTNQYMRNGTQTGHPYSFIQAPSQQQYGYYGNQVLQQQEHEGQQTLEQRNVHSVKPAGNASRQFNNPQMQMFNSFPTQAQNYLYSQPVHQQQQHFRVQQHLQRPQQAVPQYVDERNNIKYQGFAQSQQKQQQLSYGGNQMGAKLPDVPSIEVPTTNFHDKEISGSSKQYPGDPGTVITTGLTSAGFEHLNNAESNIYKRDVTESKIDVTPDDSGLPDVEQNVLSSPQHMFEKEEVKVVKDRDVPENSTNVDIFNDNVVRKETE